MLCLLEGGSAEHSGRRQSRTLRSDGTFEKASRTFEKASRRAKLVAKLAAGRSLMTFKTFWKNSNEDSGRSSNVLDEARCCGTAQRHGVAARRGGGVSGSRGKGRLLQGVRARESVMIGKPAPCLREALLRRGERRRRLGELIVYQSLISFDSGKSEWARARGPVQVCSACSRREGQRLSRFVRPGQGARPSSGQIDAIAGGEVEDSPSSQRDAGCDTVSHTLRSMLGPAWRSAYSSAPTGGPA